jgi:hypothetical protein
VRQKEFKYLFLINYFAPTIPKEPRFTHLVALMELAAEPPVLDFRTISAICGLEFARQARHDHE